MTDIQQEIKKAVLEGEDAAAFTLCREALKEGIETMTISKAIMSGVQEAGELWKQNVYFMSDMIMSAEAFRRAMEAVETYLSMGETGACRPVGRRVVIGTVAGDMHTLGKLIVKVMLQANRFEVIDLGEDLPCATFIDKVKDLNPDILGIGCYMTTTMLEIKEIIKSLQEGGLRDGVKVMIGGVPTTQGFADEAGADAWGKDALDAVEKAKQLIRSS